VNLGLFLYHVEHCTQCNLKRRGVLGLVTTAGAASMLASRGGRGRASGTAEAHGQQGGDSGGSALTDDVFDYADPANLRDWVPGPYGPGDQRGAFNEVTPDKTAEALRRTLSRGRAVKTYNLGELLFNGFPAFVTPPLRAYQQRLTVFGYTPPADFVANGGILQSTVPFGTNRISLHEERFPAIPDMAPAGTTYQIGTQLDNLNHIGAGDFFYNGFTGPDIAAAFGTRKLGNEHMGPIVTRGLVLDILGLKITQRANDALGPNAPNGKRVLRSNYRITVQDIYDAMEQARIRSLEPGDVVLFRTGWNQLLQGRDPAAFARWGGAAGVPGIYLKEARFLAQHRPAIVGSDTWCLEVLGSPDNVPGAAFPVHQELLMRHGIRIGESVIVDDLVNDGVYKFVYLITPQFAEGATAGNTPPAGLAQRR
jgi:hypothetical protein